MPPGSCGRNARAISRRYGATRPATPAVDKEFQCWYGAWPRVSAARVNAAVAGAAVEEGDGVGAGVRDVDGAGCLVDGDPTRAQADIGHRGSAAAAGVHARI